MLLFSHAEPSPAARVVRRVGGCFGRGEGGGWFGEIVGVCTEGGVEGGVGEWEWMDPSPKPDLEQRVVAGKHEPGNHSTAMKNRRRAKQNKKTHLHTHT